MPTPPDSLPAISVVIVAYNSADSIMGTVGAAESAVGHLEGEVVVIDNASSDGTADSIVAGTNRTKVFRLPENVGYGPGVNQGAIRSRGKRLLIINDDILLEKSTVDELMEALSSAPDIALAGARITDVTGRDSAAFRNNLPGWRDEYARIRDKVARTDSRHRLGPAVDGKVDVKLLLAACVLVDAELFRSLGGFNANFFLYGEDIDFCRRLEELRLRRVLVPGAVAVHNQEISPDRRPSGRSFMDRMLNARNDYYRIWLSRPSRMLLNVWRALGISDQPHRLSYHLRKAAYDGPSLHNLRFPPPLESITD